MAEVIRRADLEAQACSFPDYVGTRIFPFWGKPQVAGTYYYQDYQADGAAQYERNTATLAAITSATMASTSDTFACKEIRMRRKMGYTELIGYKDKATAELAMGRICKRGWFNKLESLIASGIMDVASPISGTSDPVAAIEDNVAALRDIGIGKVALVLSNYNKVRLKNNATVKTRMQNTGVAPAALDPRYVADGQLAAIFGVDEIITGKDALWYTGLDAADRGNVALAILPDENTEPAEEVQLGRTIYFQWDNSEADKFIMESWHDADVDAEVIDAKGLVALKTFNAELLKTIQVFSTDSE